MILFNSDSKFKPENNNTSPNLKKSYIIVRGQEILEDKNSNSIAILSEDEIKWTEMDILSTHFLGYMDQIACYASEISKNSKVLNNTKMSQMHSLLGRIQDNLFGLSSRAVQLVEWYRSNQFCGKCGDNLSKHTIERAMICQCNHLIYPKISPCIIVLVTNGESLLLAHNKNFPGEFYSTLAGFIEPGETAEEALEREVFEEVNIRIKNSAYFGSQSWPFPSQLMLGFHAEYETGEVKPDGVEIDKADWFNYKKLPQVPPANISISGQLIESYVRKLKEN